MLKKFLLALLAVASLGREIAPAQLAITESLSSASTNNVQATTAGQGPDYWELTNFGTNILDLTGYRFNDADATLGGDANSSAFSGVNIGPGESIILVQTTDGSGVTNREDFLAWWGADKLPANLQVLFYSGNGQSSSGDSLVLWNSTATSDADYVDRADFGEAVRGFAFAYNTNTGIYGVVASNGVAGAFTAALSDDVGSPGKTAGPVPLAFTQQPTPASQSVPASQDATFTVAAKGFPRPHYQWLFKGVPVEGALNASLTITNAQFEQAGNYTVLITNGLLSVTSQVAVLTVTTSPVPPIFITSPKSADAFVSQTVQLSASVNGSPTPTLQWQADGVDLPGETANTLTLVNVQSNQAAVYTIVARSTAGTNSATATLNVTAKPRLLITEVHSTGSTGFQDWWELTSFETYSINLKGWRWDDNSHSVAPNNAYVFTNDIIIRPGESVVFTENLTPAQFRAWWTNLPPTVQVVTYAGGGLGLSASGDEVNVWNAVTLPGNELFERIAGVTIGSLPVGITLVYDPENPPLGGAMTTYSTNTLGGGEVNGLMIASNGSMGSPGRVVAPVVLTNRLAGGNHELSWNAVTGRSYAVEYKADLAATNWTPLTTVTAAGASATSSEPAGAGPRFYRVGTVLPFVPQP